MLVSKEKTPCVCHTSMQKLTTPLLNETVVRSEVHELPLCQKEYLITVRSYCWKM